MKKTSTYYTFRLIFLMSLLLTFIVSACLERASAQSRYATLEQRSYHWKGGDGKDFSTPSNWMPHRSKPACHDILVFSKSDTVELSTIPFNTIGKMIVFSAANITFHLTTDTAQTLYFCQPQVNSIEIAHNSSLSFLGKAPLHLKLYGHLRVKGKLHFSQQTPQSIWVGGNLYGLDGTIAMTGDDLSHLLTLEGPINEISKFISSSSASSTVSYMRDGEQKIFPSSCYQTLNIGGTGSKYAAGTLTICTALLVEEAATLSSRGHLVKLNGEKMDIAY